MNLCEICIGFVMPFPGIASRGCPKSTKEWSLKQLPRHFLLFFTLSECQRSSVQIKLCVNYCQFIVSRMWTGCLWIIITPCGWVVTQIRHHHPPLSIPSFPFITFAPIRTVWTVSISAIQGMDLSVAVKMAQLESGGTSIKLGLA